MHHREIKISVIIPSYNSGRFLAKTLATVAKQDYPAYEVIVIDGGSTDQTFEVIKTAGPLISKFVSEPDNGQLDAVQKGIGLATGDVLYWINSDDAVMPGAFRKVANVFQSDSSIDYVFGDNYWFDEDARKFGVAHSVKRLSFWDQFLFYGQLQVEAFFWRRAISYKALPLDTSLRVYTDYSFFLPLRYHAKGKWVNQRLGAFRVHPQQMSTVNHSLGSNEREKVKERMRERLSMTKTEFENRCRKNLIYFLIRHRVISSFISGSRFIGRRISGDFFRRRSAKFFFDEWLIELGNSSYSNLPGVSPTSEAE